MKKTRTDEEFRIACAISEYMVLQYPKVIFRMDLGGLRLPMGLAVKAKRLNPYRAWPDLFIAEPRLNYLGLFIELKRSESDLRTKSGKLRKTKHIAEQDTMLWTLVSKGYQAVFACGFEEAKGIIDRYLRESK